MRIYVYRPGVTEPIWTWNDEDAPGGRAADVRYLPHNGPVFVTVFESKADIEAYNNNIPIARPKPVNKLQFYGCSVVVDEELGRG